MSKEHFVSLKATMLLQIQIYIKINFVVKGNPGFNPDLMVMDLVKLRASSVYKSMIHELKISLLLKKYSMHLEEDLPDLGEILNLIAAEKPQMFHKLSCEWNKSANQGMNMKN